MAVLLDESDAQVVVGSDHVLGETELADQVHGGGLDGEEAIGAGFDGAAFDVLGLDNTSQARAGFDNCGRRAGFGKVVSGGESADAAADNDYARHRRATSASAF